MKCRKQFTNVLWIGLWIVMLAFAPQKVQASSGSIPTKARCGIGIGQRETFYIYHTNKNDIRNLKSKNKYLKVRAIPSKDEEGYETLIAFYGLKDGTYKFSFDLYTAGKKKTYTVTVYAEKTINGSIKWISLDGKKIISREMYDSGIYPFYTTKKSAKLKLQLQKKMKLTKITLVTVNKKGKRVSKTIKNGAKVTLNKIGGYSYEKDADGGYSMSKDMIASTTVIYTYKDLVDGKTHKEEIEINTPAAAWS